MVSDDRLLEERSALNYTASRLADRIEGYARAGDPDANALLRLALLEALGVSPDRGRVIGLFWKLWTSGANLADLYKRCMRNLRRRDRAWVRRRWNRVTKRWEVYP